MRCSVSSLSLNARIISGIVSDDDSQTNLTIQRQNILYERRSTVIAAEKIEVATKKNRKSY